MASILLVDDDPQVLKLLLDYLTRQGHEVACASNGKEAVKIMRVSHIDLCLMDIIMPGKDGLETIPEFRQAHPSIKILAVSGGGSMGSSEYLKMAQALGADRALAKPFTFQALKDAVDSLLAG